MQNNITTECFKIGEFAFKVSVCGDKIRELNFVKPHKLSRAGGENPLIKRLKQDLKDYISGKDVKFNYKLDLSGYSAFCRSVWKNAQKIPFRHVWSYKKLSCKIGKNNAFRAVGLALGKNPVIILIPCHRVIKSDGSLGGFSSGIQFKKKLLKIEGVCK